MSLKSLGEKVQELVQAEERNAENVDAFFMVSMAALVLLMQFGFAIRECGAVRSKHVSRVLLRSILCTSIGVTCNWFVGYGVGFGDGNAFLGENYFAASALPKTHLSHFLFHMITSVITISILASALMERCHLAACIISTITLTGFVQPCVVHWAWHPTGWLNVGINVTGTDNVTVTFQDYAGSGVIHMGAGTMALIGCLLLGARIGRYEECGHFNHIPAHSVPLSAVGSFLIIVGFMGLASGSLGHVTQPGDGATIGLVNTNLITSGFISLVTTAIIQMLVSVTVGGRHRFHLVYMANALLMGMVSMSAGANAVETWAATVIGLIAGMAFAFLTWFYHRIRIDDPLDVIPVHMGGGMWGLIAVPLLRKDDGILYTASLPGWTLFGWHMAGMLAIVAWFGFFSIFLFGLVYWCGRRTGRLTDKMLWCKRYQSEVSCNCNKKSSHDNTCCSHQHAVIPRYSPCHASSYTRGVYEGVTPLRWKY